MKPCLAVLMLLAVGCGGPGPQPDGGQPHPAPAFEGHFSGMLTEVRYCPGGDSAEYAHPAVLHLSKLPDGGMEAPELPALHMTPEGAAFEVENAHGLLTLESYEHLLVDIRFTHSTRDGCDGYMEGTLNLGGAGAPWDDPHYPVQW